MRAKGGEKKKKTLTATVQEVFLEQGAVRAVWILSAMTARGAAGCSASAFVRPLALQNVASWLISGSKEMSGGLHRVSPEGRIRADMMLLVTRIPSHAFASIHTLYSVKLLRRKPGSGGRGEESSPEHLLEESWASYRYLWKKSHVRVSVYMYEDV